MIFLLFFVDSDKNLFAGVIDTCDKFLFSDNSEVFPEIQERLLKLRWLGTQRVQMKGNLSLLVCWACLASPVQKKYFFHHLWKSRLKCRLSLRRNEFHYALGIHFKIANSWTIRRGIFKGLHLCNNLSNDPNFGRIHIAWQYFLPESYCSKIKFYFILVRAHLWKHPHRGYCEHKMGRFWAQSTLCVKLAFGQASKTCYFLFFCTNTENFGVCHLLTLSSLIE